MRGSSRGASRAPKSTVVGALHQRPPVSSSSACARHRAIGQVLASELDVVRPAAAPCAPTGRRCARSAPRRGPEREHAAPVARRIQHLVEHLRLLDRARKPVEDGAQPLPRLPLPSRLLADGWSGRRAPTPCFRACAEPGARRASSAARRRRLTTSLPRTHVGATHRETAATRAGWRPATTSDGRGNGAYRQSRCGILSLSTFPANLRRDFTARARAVLNLYRLDRGLVRNRRASTGRTDASAGSPPSKCPRLPDCAAMGRRRMPALAFGAVRREEHLGERLQPRVEDAARPPAAVASPAAAAWAGASAAGGARSAHSGQIWMVEAGSMRKVWRGSIPAATYAYTSLSLLPKPAYSPPVLGVRRRRRSTRRSHRAASP